jgi:ABC-type glycerol-3-phosphate transport system permease component
MPISTPVLAAIAIFTFQFAWNWFLHPLVYLGGDKNLWPLSLGLNALKGEQGGPPSTHYQMAFSVLMILPMVAVFAIGQRYFIQGIVTSGIKG